MKPLWSNKEISLPIAGIESDTEMLRVAELLRYAEILFHFYGRGNGVWRCAYPFCQSSRHTHQSRSIIQLQGSSYNSWGLVFPVLFFFFFLPGFFPHFWNMFHLLFNFTAKHSTWHLDHPTLTFYWQGKIAGHTPLLNYLTSKITDTWKERAVHPDVFNLSSLSSVSAHFKKL